VKSLNDSEPSFHIEEETTTPKIYTCMKHKFVHKRESVVQQTCMRCGTCCKKGGPILHQEDKKILLDGHAGHQHLVTIRKGELSINPLTDALEPVHEELIKVTGKHDEWTCIFYNAQKSACLLYKNRFLECRLLKCWDINDFLSVFGKSTLTRSDLINAGDAILDVMKDHDRLCPASDFEKLISYVLRGKNKEKNKKKLAVFVHKDMEIRTFAIHELGMKAEFEHFIFGRPLADIIKLRGLVFKIS
jgi:Fe-S-cluster containining protein